MEKDLFYRVLYDRQIPKHIEDDNRYVNCIQEIPDMNIESNVEWVKPKELIKKTVEFNSQISCQHNWFESCFFFSKKETLRQVYKWVNNCSAVGMVDADCTESRKRQLFDEFENIN